MAKKRADITKPHIVDAAIKCFVKYGAHRTSMSDVADEAGISRQSIYRLFADRSQLIQNVLVLRITALAETLGTKFAAYSSVEEAIVEGSLLSVRAGREDELFADIVNTTLDHSIELFLFKGSPEIQEAMMTIWTPIISAGRIDGRIRADRTDDQIVEWLRHTHAMLTARDDLDESEQRRLLRDFVVPSIVTDRSYSVKG